MDTFTITAYNKTTDVATVNFTLNASGEYAGETLTGVKISGIPKDTVAHVKTYLRGYANAYVNGKINEQNRQGDISNDVKALLNVATTF